VQRVSSSLIIKCNVISFPPVDGYNGFLASAGREKFLLYNILYPGLELVHISEL